ncbi:hypothetical protein I4U23_003585 [Adineta vaga]|nr:hypothetical protein I4U23_003585 [Adineta vaga]
MFSFNLALYSYRGFSNKTDIGYDSCSPLAFDLFTTSILCLCATNICNQNLGTCQSSVNSQLQTNTAPPVLSSMIPGLEASISCFDTAYPSYSTSYCIDLASPFIDIPKCNAYF